jgi:hypothetical protein
MEEIAWETQGWEDNIKTYLKEIDCTGTDWIQLAVNMIQCQVFVNTVMKCQVP